MNEPTSAPVEPCTLTVEIPATDAAHLAMMVALLDQLVAQIWEQHGPALTEYLLQDFRRRNAIPTVRVLPR